MKTTIAIFLALLAFNGARSQPSPILITDVTLIDVRNGELLEGRQVLIDSGIIQSIGNSVPPNNSHATTIPGRGKFLIPGLAEMHAHIPSPPVSPERVEETLFLYLSNGVTTIRGMLGHPSHLELREKTAARTLLGPRIITSSPSFSGNTVPTAEEAGARVREYKKAGYDFLKLHPGIKLEVFNEIAETAREEGIPFSGHVPVQVGILHALESGYASIDHIDGFLEGLVPGSAGVNPEENGFFGYNFTPLADSSKIGELVALSKEKGVWVVPTQSLFERWFAPVPTADLLQQPEMKYMPRSTLGDWERIKNETTGAGSGFSAEQWERFIEIRRTLLRQLQDEGQGLLLGSDAPQLFNVPGFSIHHEIQGMLRAGLSPLEILQTGTRNPALFFGMEDRFGEIREGMEADLVLLDANPLEDLEALKQIQGVVVRGQWLSKEIIQARLAGIEANAARQ